MKKKRFIDKCKDCWNHPDWDMHAAGCTNMIDSTAVFSTCVMYAFMKMLGYIFLAITAIVWLPVYALYCWITERRYRK